MPVYFIRGRDAIKIGFSLEPRLRLRELQTSHSEPLELLGIMDGNPDVERGLHERFAALRRSGEWFEASEALLTFVAENSSLPPPASKRQRAQSKFDKGAASKILIEFLTARHPDRTAEAVSEATGINKGTIRSWLNRGSLPAADTVLTLVEVYGPPFLIEVVAPSIGQAPKPWMFPPNDSPGSAP